MIDRAELESFLCRIKHDLEMCEDRLKNPKPEDGDALKGRLRLAIMNMKMQIKSIEESLQR